MRCSTQRLPSRHPAVNRLRCGLTLSFQSLSRWCARSGLRGRKPTVDNKSLRSGFLFQPRRHQAVQNQPGQGRKCHPKWGLADLKYQCAWCQWRRSSDSNRCSRKPRHRCLVCDDHLLRCRKPPDAPSVLLSGFEPTPASTEPYSHWVSRSTRSGGGLGHHGS